MPRAEGVLIAVLAAALAGAAAAAPAPVRAAGPAAVNVRDFGARGDDAADDSAALQRAIDAAAASHGAVLFPPGIYRTTRTLTLAGAVTLTGAGAADQAASSGTVLRVANVDAVGIKILAPGCRIQGIMLDAALGSASQDGIWVGDADADAGNTVLRDVTVRGFGGSGVWCRSGNANLLENVAAIGNGRHGVRLESVHPTVANVNATTALHLRLTGNRGSGLHVERAESSVVLNAVAQGNGEYGVFVNWPRNTLSVYTEGNAAGSVRMGESAYDCLVTGTMNEGEPSIVNRANLVFVQNGGTFTLRLFGQNPLRRLSATRVFVELPAVPAGGAVDKTLHGITGARPTRAAVTATPELGERWRARRAYAAGDLVRSTAAPPLLFESLNGGASGDREPAWPATPDALTVDGAVRWRCLGPQAIAPGLIWQAFPVDDDAVVLRLVNTADQAVPASRRPWQIQLAVWDD